MAVYATVQQAIDLYGADYIAVACDRDGDGEVDLTSFEKHLSSASRRMDAYLLGRYPLPLANPPEHFQNMCVDLAVKAGAPSADVLTQEMKDRAKEAREDMLLYAQGKLKLETATDTTEVNQSREASIENRLDLSLTEGSREMRRERLRGLL